MKEMRVLPDWITPQGGSFQLRILVQPKASRTEFVGIHDQRLKIRLKAPPVDGAANKELIRFLSKRLKISRSVLDIVSGKTGRRKVVKIPNIDPELILSLLMS